VSKNKKSKIKTNKWAKYLPLFFVGIMLVAYIISFPPKIIQKLTAQNTVSVIPSPTKILTPTPTTEPTVTPTPSPTPLSGYCLRVPVLMYHHIQPQQMAIDKKETSLNVDSGTFDQHMAYLVSQGYTTITADQLVNALISHSPLPAKSIVLTFDDGYKDNFEYAHPIIQKYNLTAHLALATGLVGGENYLSWDQVRQMAGSGRWHIINHTWSHYSLGRGDSAKITYEVTTAKQQIQDNTGQSTDIFVYPYGTLGGFGTLKELGVKGAFSTIPGQLQCDSILFQLRRTRVGNSPLSSYGL
jgi:peptidoglycan/xylan/chitin deacetylase (PgdA/CDA1 family)